MNAPGFVKPFSPSRFPARGFRGGESFLSDLGEIMAITLRAHKPEGEFRFKSEGPTNLTDPQRNRIGLQMNAQCSSATWGKVAVKLEAVNDNTVLKADDKIQ